MSDYSSSSSDIVSIDSGSSAESSPRHSVDEFRGMRLFIDNMTYEDLLALADWMGYVPTGIPEDRISSCLTAKICGLLDLKEGKSCPICLEAYRMNEEISAINRCGHEYHAVCITQWLEMKNSCPVCRCRVLE